MKRLLLAAAVLAVTTMTSCSSDNKTEQQDTTANTTGEPTTTAAIDTTLTEDKQQLMQRIAQHAMLQTELGKIATAKGTTDDVKQYGQEMQQAYTNQQKELQEVAQEYNVSLNTTLEEDYRKFVDNLNKKSGTDFDKEYWKSVTDAQKKTLDEYDDVLKDITEADATAFGIWARTSEKELRARYEQSLAQEQQLRNRL